MVFVICGFSEIPFSPYFEDSLSLEPRLGRDQALPDPGWDGGLSEKNRKLELMHLPRMGYHKLLQGVLEGGQQQQHMI